MPPDPLQSDLTFDPTKGYKAKELNGPYFDDGREIELLHFVYSRPNLESIRNSPKNVLAAIDEYGRTEKYLMNVGEDKGRIVCDIIEETKPAIMVELGGYVGYSTILFADALRRSGGKTYYCLERNPEFGAVVASLADLAGLSDVVRVVVGTSSSSVARLHAEGLLSRIDMMFLDHYKPAYTPDLKLAEELGLISPGTVLCADNVIYPGNPPYLEYVRRTVQQKREALSSHADANATESFREETTKQYEKREGHENVDGGRKGNPNLIYESELKRSFEPTGEEDGVEVTRCVGDDKSH